MPIAGKPGHTPGPPYRGEVSESCDRLRAALARLERADERYRESYVEEFAARAVRMIDGLVDEIDVTVTNVHRS